jgi:cephalosporin-C deacetylase-like acetyl esterase
MIGRLKIEIGYSRLVAMALVIPLVISMSCWGQEIFPQNTQSSRSVAAAKTNPTSQTNDIEHWDVLPLAGNSLDAAPPLLGEKDALPGFTRELIQVQWRAHDPIDLYVIRPTNVTKPPVVLFLYGYPSDTDRFRNDIYCQSVVSHGFAAVGFVSALTGQRYHGRPMKEWFISELPEALGTSVHDVQMILNYLATRDDIDMGRVGMYGQGSGGTIAILSASVDPRIKAVDVLDPWGDWPDWIANSSQIPDGERAVYLEKAFLEKAAPFDPVLWLSAWKSRPLRLQQTLFSEVTPVNARSRIQASVPANARILQYRDVREYEDKASAGAKVLDWMKSQLDAMKSQR